MKISIRIVVLLLLPLAITGQQADPYLYSLHTALSGTNNDTARMQAYSDLGSYYILDNRDSASYYLEKAYSLTTALNLKLNEAIVLNRLGIIQMQQEKYSRSLEYYLKAMHIAKDPSIERTIWKLPPGQSPMSARMLEISRSYDFIGLLNAYTGNWTVNINNQVKNYLEAEKYAKASGNQNQIATVIFHMGISLKSAGKLDSALILLTKARSMFSDLKDPQLGRAYIYLGETYEAKGDLSMARSALLQAILHLNATNDNVHRGLAYMTLSRIYAGLSKTDSALYCALESFRIFEKRRDAAWKRDVSNMLSVYYDQLGKADSATLYLKLAKSLSDSLSIEERKNLLAFQDILIDEQTKLEKLEKERIEAREKMRTYLLMSGIALFLAIALLLYRNNRVRKRTNEMLQQRNEKIENTLHRLRSTQAQLIQSEKMASLGELTAGIAHEIQNPLNFVNNFSEASSELIDEMKDKIRDGNYEEVNAIADDVKQNLEKIGHHGKRADNIVKGMLQHSRRSSGQKEYVNINSLCEEYVRLAYHGFHARNNDSSVQLVTELDPALPKVPIIPQDIGRVILNLLNNAFYYALEGSGLSEGDHQPKVILRTQKREKNVAIIVEDNGKGIPESIKDKIFQPFFTTKPTGQGTGLGLSLSYDIVKAHGGELTVETKEGQGTTFFILLPLS